jgi:glycosyltransferase involved in cell wall biosynthesis
MKGSGGEHLSVSVVMSCFNAERWLEESVSSVLDQSHTDLELILVDDGSTDGTRPCIEALAARDARVVPVFKPNTGLADSLNVGAGMAKGAWLARLDADDVMSPSRLEEQLKAINSRHRVVFVGSGLVEVDEEGRRLRSFTYPTGHAKLVARLRTGKGFPAHSSALIEMEAFRRIGGYRPRFVRSQDLDLWLRLSEVGELTSVSVPLVQVRSHRRQISFTDGGEQSKIFAEVARVSYWLRTLGRPDPVDASTTDFEHFRSWIAWRVRTDQARRVEWFRKALRRARDEYGISGLFVCGALSVKCPVLAWRAVAAKLFGSASSRRLADEWSSESRMEF